MLRPYSSASIDQSISIRKYRLPSSRRLRLFNIVYATLVSPAPPTGSDLTQLLILVIASAWQVKLLAERQPSTAVHLIAGTYESAVYVQSSH